eukprot:scaffold1425_cov333-Prasinococcus_capsulatus_cf.AAC.8
MVAYTPDESSHCPLTYFRVPWSDEQMLVTALRNSFIKQKKVKVQGANDPLVKTLNSIIKECQTSKANIGNASKALRDITKANAKNKVQQSAVASNNKPNTAAAKKAPPSASKKAAPVAKPPLKSAGMSPNKQQASSSCLR